MQAKIAGWCLASQYSLLFCMESLCLMLKHLTLFPCLFVERSKQHDEPRIAEFEPYKDP